MKGGRHLRYTYKIPSHQNHVIQHHTCALCDRKDAVVVHSYRVPQKPTGLHAARFHERSADGLYGINLCTRCRELNAQHLPPTLPAESKRCDCPVVYKKLAQ